MPHRCGRPKRLRNQERRRNRSVGSRSVSDSGWPPIPTHPQASAMIRSALAFRYARRVRAACLESRHPDINRMVSVKRMRASMKALLGSRVVSLRTTFLRHRLPYQRPRLVSTDGTNRAMRSGRSDRPDSSRGFISIGVSDRSKQNHVSVWLRKCRRLVQPMSSMKESHQFPACATMVRL